MNIKLHRGLFLLLAALLGIASCCSTPSVRNGEIPGPTSKRSSIFESAIVAFERQDRLSPPPDKPILFVGSSTIRFWKSAESFPNLPTLNRGFGGSQVDDVLYYFDRVVARYHPVTIVFYSGDNDLAFGKTPDQVTRDIGEFIRLVNTRLPGTRLIVFAIKPSIARWNLRDKMRQTNRNVEQLVEACPGGIFLDVTPEILGENGRPRSELFRIDGLHLNERGYAILNARLEPLLNEGK